MPIIMVQVTMMKTFTSGMMKTHTLKILMVMMSMDSIPIIIVMEKATTNYATPMNMQMDITRHYNPEDVVKMLNTYRTVVVAPDTNTGWIFLSITGMSMNILLTCSQLILHMDTGTMFMDTKDAVKTLSMYHTRDVAQSIIMEKTWKSLQSTCLLHRNQPEGKRGDD